MQTRYICDQCGYTCYEDGPPAVCPCCDELIPLSCPQCGGQSLEAKQQELGDKKASL